MDEHTRLCTLCQQLTGYEVQTARELLLVEFLHGRSGKYFQTFDTMTLTLELRYSHTLFLHAAYFTAKLDTLYIR